MRLREFLRLILPSPFEPVHLTDSRQAQAEIERRQREIERRLQVLGYEVDTIKRRGTDDDY